MRLSKNPIGRCYHSVPETDVLTDNYEFTETDGGGSERLSVNLHLANGGGTPTDGAGAEFVVPDMYTEKEWVKGIKSVDDLWKMNDNAQSLLGKKTLGVPTDTSTPDEVMAFNKAFGVPETADEYDFKDDGTLKRVYGESSDDVAKEFKNLLHKAKASTKQAKILQEGYGQIVANVVEKMQSNAVAIDTDFELLADKTFGNKKAKVLDTAKTLLAENAPEGFTEYLGTLSNESLIVMAGVLNNIQTKYIDEDKIPIGQSAVGQSEDTIRLALQKVIASPEFQNQLNPSHDMAKREWLRLSAQLGAIRNRPR